MKSTENPKKDDIVVYYAHNLRDIGHSGKFISEKEVSSKWASGPIFKHETFMCQYQYGDSVTYFEAIDPESAKKLIEKYKDINKSALQP